MEQFLADDFLSLVGRVFVGDHVVRIERLAFLKGWDDRFLDLL